MKSHPEWTEMKRENSSWSGSFQASFCDPSIWDSVKMLGGENLLLYFLFSFFFSGVTKKTLAKIAL